MALAGAKYRAIRAQSIVESPGKTSQSIGEVVSVVKSLISLNILT